MKWIARQAELEKAFDDIDRHDVIGVDTEADSLHSYFDKVCLIQISTADEDYLIDPLASIDLARFGRTLSDPRITKILHGADYDLRILNRDFGFTITNIVDTMIAAQLLGYESFGLAALLDRHFQLKVDKAHQRADWAMRPLPPDMVAYATMDTHYLVRLYDMLRRELEALGRWEWAQEEFARLEAIRYRETDESEEPFRRLKHIGAFDRRSLAVVRELYNWRDALARSADRPPFKIIGNDVILELAKSKPATREDLEKTKGLAKFHFDRYGRDLLARVTAAVALPEEALPQRVEGKAWLRDKALEARIDRLKKVRDRIATELKIEPSMLAPRHVLQAIATLEPKHVAELDAVPALRQWQRRLLGELFVQTLQPAQMTL